MVLVKKFEWLTGNADRFPQLIPDQILKLKQLTVLTLADTYKVLPIKSTVIGCLVLLFRLTWC